MYDAQIQQAYEQIYGPKTAIFFRVGAFYQMYDNVRQVSQVLNMPFLTKKIDLLGIACYTYDSTIKPLIDLGWTVCIHSPENMSIEI